MDPHWAPAAAAAGVIAAAVLGFLAGMRWAPKRYDWRRKRKEPPRMDVLCECGTIIRGVLNEEDILRHKQSKRHQRSLHRHTSSDVVVCEEIGEYRAAAVTLVNNKDVVLEIGSHVGGTTKFLAGVARRLVGFDQQPTLVAEARQRLPEVEFEIGDAFDVKQMMDVAEKILPDRFNKVFIDISGSREIGTVVRLIQLVDSTLKPELLVVKSQALKKLVLRSQLWVHLPAARAFQESGNGTVPADEPV